MVRLLGKLVLISVASLAFTWQADCQVAMSDAAHQQFVFAYRLLQRHEDVMAAEAFDEFLGNFPRHEKRGDALYYRALLARRVGDQQLAAKLLGNDERLTVVPGYALLLLKGQVNLDLGRYGEAMGALERIDTAKLEQEVVASVVYLRGIGYRRMNNPAGAMEQFERASAIRSPLQAKAMLELAGVQQEVGLHEEAVGSLEGCLALGEVQLIAQAARRAGDLSYELGEYAKAEEFYKRVLSGYQQTEHFGPAAIGLMWSRFSGERFAAVIETEQLYHKALNVEDQITSKYLAGSALMQMQRYEKAAEYFQGIRGQAVGLKLEDKLLYKIASCEFELGRIEQMKRTLEELKRKHPGSEMLADGEFLLAAGESAHGEATAAIARVTGVVAQGESHPYYGQGLLQRARLYEQVGQIEAAAADYQKVCDLTNNQKQVLGGIEEQLPQVYLQLADLYYRLEQYVSSQQAARSAMGQGNEPGIRQEGYYRLALAEIRLGEHEQGMRSLDKLLGEYPHNVFKADALYYRGLLLISDGKTQEAMQSLENAVGVGGDDGLVGLDAEKSSNALRLLVIAYREGGDEDAAASWTMRLESTVGLGKLTAGELIWCGRYFFEAGDYERGLSYLQEIWSGERDTGGGAVGGAGGEEVAEGKYLAGRCYIGMGDWSNAERMFRGVIAGGEGYELESRLAWAGALGLQGLSDEALDLYSGLINVRRYEIAACAVYESARLHEVAAGRHRVNSYDAAAKESMSQAKRMYTRVVLLFGGGGYENWAELSLIALADMAEDEGDKQEAVKQLEELTKRYGEGSYVLYARAKLAGLRGDKHEVDYLLKKLHSIELDARLYKLVSEFGREQRVGAINE